MKKIIILAAAILISASAFAHSRPDFGIKAGLNMANITKAGDSKMKPSLYVGVFAEFKLTYFMSIQPELLYSRQGAYYKEGDVKAWERLNYINLPIMFKFYMLDGFSLDLGPQFGYMIGAKTKIKGSIIPEENGTHDNDDTKDFDVSFAMGLGYKITPKFDVSARYNLGFTKVGSIEGMKSKNSVIQFGLGYRF